MKEIKHLLPGLYVLLLCGSLHIAASGQPEESRPDRPGLRMSWFSLGVTAGTNEGISARIGIWRYGKLELSAIWGTNYIRYFGRPADFDRFYWNYRGHRFCVQALYRQYWPETYRLGWDQLKLSWGLSGGAAWLFWREGGNPRGVVGGPFCELWMLDRVSLQVDLLLYHSRAFPGQVGIGPTATLYYNF